MYIYRLNRQNFKEPFFSGDFVRGENLEQILRIITADKRTDYTMRGDSICIYEK
ncbi:FecR domain-containing protein [Parabacteroides distasonis]|uniref:FecR domain-containing protein n=1 Tax=Parabacteroides distasonis TaxID=823 RepID=UPI0031F435F8